jgi:hypothetical protein
MTPALALAVSLWVTHLKPAHLWSSLRSDDDEASGREPGIPPGYAALPAYVSSVQTLKAKARAGRVVPRCHAVTSRRKWRWMKARSER